MFFVRVKFKLGYLQYESTKCFKFIVPGGTTSLFSRQSFCNFIELTEILWHSIYLHLRAQIYDCYNKYLRAFYTIDVKENVKVYLDVFIEQGSNYFKYIFKRSYHVMVFIAGAEIYPFLLQS